MNLPVNAGDTGLIPGLGRSPGERNTTHSSIPAWKIHGQRRLVGWDHKESTMTERLTLSHFPS